MADRFERLFSLPNNLYINDSPVIILAGALLKDHQTNTIIAQLKLQNLSLKIIKAVKISLNVSDIVGKPLEGVDEYQYLDMSISSGGVFGTDKAIIMPNNNSRSFEIASIMVVFSDNSIWEGNGESFCSLPFPTKLFDSCNGSIIQQYRISTTDMAMFVPQDNGDVWTCTCGCINKGDACSHCHCYKNTVFSSFDIPTLTLAMNERIEKAKAQQELKEKSEKEKKKKSKRIKLIILSAIAIAIIGLIAYNVIVDYVIPENKYQNAIDCFNKGDYVAGRDILLELNCDYKDSKSLILKYSNKGDIVKMGSYAGESVEWLVIAKESNKLLLISKECLFKHEYSDTENSGGYSWYGSSLRDYLNGSFYRTTFTSDEKEIILTTKVNDTKQPEYGKVYNYETKDKLFLLSVDEARKYFNSNNERSAGKTYWLRSVGWQYFCASQIEPDGAIDDQGANILDDFYYVRPAMWVSID